MTNKNQSITIQFFKGIDEKVHPEVRLIRNRDKKSGQATYKFFNPTSIVLTIAVVPIPAFG